MIIIPGQKKPEPERRLAPVSLLNGVLVCNECSQLMIPSGEISETLVGYPSPPGHDHDDNCECQIYTCPNGHRRKISKRRRCQKCEWVGKESCFCHDGLKVDEWPKYPVSPKEDGKADLALDHSET
jgi:hypothetical protein